MMMNDEIQAYLDRETPIESLPPEARRDAEKWESLLVEAREAGAPGAPVGLESRIMRSVRAESTRTPWSRLVDWWVHPRRVRIRPMVGLAAAAAVALLMVPLWSSVSSDRLADGGFTDETTYVQFLLDAPEANSVAVSGDFNEWAIDQDLEDVDGDGVWSGRVALPPGVHRYMFVVDGQQWITDPHAERYSEDGFGNRNAVLTLTGGAGSGALAP